MKQLIKKFARLFGAELISGNTFEYWQRQSLTRVLTQAVGAGLDVRTVIDVGAAHGDWSRLCATALPHASYILFEPLAEYGPDLDSAVTAITRAEHHGIALHASSGEKTINVHPDLVGSSFFREKEDSDVNGVPRTVRAETLDSMVGDSAYGPPYLLKIDVQGAELDVLEGGPGILKSCGFVILETSFFDFYDNRQTVGHVVEFMLNRGFVVYDIFGLSYRPLDGALAQADLCFVPEHSILRSRHVYADGAQRREVTARLQRQHSTSHHSAKDNGAGVNGR